MRSFPLSQAIFIRLSAPQSSNRSHDPALAGCHQVYKEQTTRIVEYLARTASQCCDISHILASLKNNDRNRRLAEVGGTVPVQTAEFVLLARAIANASPPIPIPRGVLTLVCKTISGRQHVSDTITADRRRHLSEDDLGHLHFIDILREVYVILEEASQRPSPPDMDPGENDGSSLKDSSFTTIFSELDVEDTSDDSASAPFALPSINLAKVKFACAAKELESSRFKLLCHLQDLYELRNSVHDVWLQYNKGDVSHMHASMATSSAIALMKCANAEFVAIHPELEHYDQITRILDIDSITFDDGTDVWFHRKTPNEPTTDGGGCFEIPQLLCWHGAQLLHMALGRICKTLNFPNAHNTRDDRSKLTLKFATHPFAVALLSDLEITTLVTSALDQEQGDILAGIVDAWRRDQRIMWVCIALQICMDICDIGPSNLDVGIAHLKRTLRTAEEKRVAFDAFRAQYSRPTALDQAAERLRSNAQVARAALQKLDSQSPSFQTVKKHGSGGKLSMSDKKLVDSYKQSRTGIISGAEHQIPSLAGAATFMTSRAMAVAGCYASNTEKLLQCMAFLYRAAKRFDFVTSDWQDMEFVISTRSSTDGPLVPKMKASSKAKEYLAHLEHSTGLRINRRQIGSDQDSFIRFKCTKPIKMPDESFAMKHLGKAEPNSKGPGSYSKAVQITLHEIRSLQGIAPSVQVLGQRDMFTPLELHETFKRAFIRDEPYLNFDWVGLWLNCAPLLKEMYAATGRESDTDLHDQLIEMSFDLMLQLVLDEQDGLDLSESAFAKAGKVLDEYIKAHGQDFRKAAFEQSSGKIPKSLKPKLGQSAFEADAQKLEQLRGVLAPECSVTGSRDLLVFYDPRLKLEDMRRDEDGNLLLPPYMFRDSDCSDEEDRQE